MRLAIVCIVRNPFSPIPSNQHEFTLSIMIYEIWFLESALLVHPESVYILTENAYVPLHLEIGTLKTSAAVSARILPVVICRLPSAHSWNSNGISGWPNKSESGQVIAVCVFFMNHFGADVSWFISGWPNTSESVQVICGLCNSMNYSRADFNWLISGWPSNTGSGQVICNLCVPWNYPATDST